jgi:hypothetical protein
VAFADNGWGGAETDCGVRCLAVALPVKELHQRIQGLRRKEEAAIRDFVGEFGPKDGIAQEGAHVFASHPQEVGDMRDGERLADWDIWPLRNWLINSPDEIA